MELDNVSWMETGRWFYVQKKKKLKEEHPVNQHPYDLGQQDDRCL